ncbi:Transposase [Actinoplanes derwentensis]|uniref:Transposase n=1 Tax=Actinoplanes derwentensis TaxID=113562 RepID=A0A1H1PLW2_9ACTN|nr:Transposase [Actinoplanes derwentensis]SDS57265.1 Transposase [Actinoplanes derwentensis]SDS71808.1 Transposase [Actinoplanes derwentensis]SDT59265.1 Transposase [Actinoplanes derwentensis]SDT71452.1 Transposase [Actinoplanes derwentensis]
MIVGFAGWKGFRVSLEAWDDRGVPELTARVVRASFPKGTLAVRIRDALGPVFGDSAFALAFPAVGRPAASPGVLALVSVLQYAEGLSDRQAADQVRARMDWKYLLGLELDDPGFDYTILGDFRARLIKHGLEEKVLEVILDHCSRLGLLRAGGRQRTDSTHVLAAVRTLNRMEFVGETLRAALEVLAKTAPQWLAPRIDADWAGRYGARIDSYRFPKGDDVRMRWAEQVGRDGYLILDAVAAPGAPAWLREIPAVQVLGQVWEQQYQRAGEEVHWREGKDLPPSRNRLASPYDIDARYGLKRGLGWSGYKVHFSETCEADLPRIITGVLTTDATVTDTETTGTIHQNMACRQRVPGEHVVDAGYVTAAHIVTARDEHGIDLLGPVGLDTHQGERFPQSAFRIDWQSKAVTCPQGKTSISWSAQRKSSGTELARVHFAAGDCTGCPVRAECTTASVNSKWGRSLTLLPAAQQEVLEARRGEQVTEAWQQRYHIRAGVEATISQVVRHTGIRSTRYTGADKTHLGHLLAATAANIVRIDAWLTGTPLGRTRTSHLTQLDLDLAG